MLLESIKIALTLIAGSILPLFCEMSLAQTSDLPGYIKIAETKYKDKVYVRADNIRIRKQLRRHTVGFSLLTKFSSSDDGVWKRSIAYTADCNTNVLHMSSYSDYGDNNQIIDSKTFGMTTASRYQSRAKAPQSIAYPNTAGHVALKYVCFLDN